MTKSDEQTSVVFWHGNKLKNYDGSNPIPHVSIVTINFNNGNELTETLKNIVSQSYRSKEIIVIDGGSTDSSLQVLSKYQENIDSIICEPDRGIYDAMLKGVRIARGEFVCFMNSGDQFFSQNVLEEIFKDKAKHSADIIYGGHEVRYAGGWKRIQWPEDPVHLWKRMVCSHQSMFVKRDILLKHGFDHSYRLNADYAFIYRAYRAGYRFFRLNMIVSSISAGGRSDVDRSTSILSRWRIVKEDCSNFKVTLYYSFILVDSWLRKFSKSLLPSKLVNRIAASKNSRMQPLGSNYTKSSK